MDIYHLDKYFVPKGEIMGKFGVNYGKIQGFEIKEIQETPDCKVLHLGVYNDAGWTKYRICDDIREPDLNLIRKNLEEGLTQAQSTDKDFMINEYIERDYIFVKYPNGETKQYSAQRVKF
jgi:hypothetical protein